MLQFLPTLVSALVVECAQVGVVDTLSDNGGTSEGSWTQRE